jgi:dipeptidyl aminopeptidase/acylaminoacyl peptidase
MKRTFPSRWKLAVLLTAVLFADTAGMAEKNSVNAVLNQLASVRRFRQTAISPDATHAAWVETLRGANGAPSGYSAIYVAPLSDPAAAKRISAARDKTPHNEHDIAWSPDSRKLAFLSDAAGDRQSQLYVANVTTGSARQLTHFTGYLSAPRWSPDGKTLALLFIENAPRAAGPLVAMEPAVGVIEENFYEQRLTTVPAAGGEARQISPPDMYVYEYDWSPDGRTFAATAAHGSGDDNWWIAQLYTLPAAGGAMKSILKPPLQINMPRWSPDGRNIAYIGGLMSDFGSIGGDIYVMPAGGGEARNLTPGMKASASWIAWLASGQIFAVENADGQSAIALVDPGVGGAKTLWTAAETVHAEGWSPAASVARDGTMTAMIRSSFQHPFEVWAGPVGEWKQVTHANREVQPMWGDGRSLHWSSDGMTIQGWLLYPRNYDRARRYPLVVVVHGGPAGACLPNWPGQPLEAPLASQGYFVLCPNPRGSMGFGEAFTQANVKDFGHGDLRDILAGAEQALKEASVDPQRVGLTGWSYGGYMTMWAVTQTKRFRAAMAGAGIANWVSYYGQNDIDQWMIPYFGATVYDDPEVYAKSAPINYIKQAKTPTLVVVGERDGECPAPQSFEFWHALKTFGVPTQLVVYPNEGHMFSDPEHVRDLVERMLDWFAKYMPETAKAQAAGVN